MRRALVLPVAACAVAAGGCQQLSDGAGKSAIRGDEGKVVRVVDAETIVVLSEGKRQTLRLIGIDAPTGGDCFADEATAELQRLLRGREVVFKRGVGGLEDDGRQPAHVYRIGDDLWLSRALVEGGFVHQIVEPLHREKNSSLDRTADEAEEAGRGLHGAC